ncbi:hypothetical protein QZJ86_04320 [Methylomonas montana]|uniref:hypothetical protein n=1 Tax=Methylomonas montana TaxID=3058963 RepID=UPI0026585A0C|nr:hypothetical protein [Methylomonas montana]WKJ91361.1 hypothetical protein QZJ86_04320 [Methylomonas montana]
MATNIEKGTLSLTSKHRLPALGNEATQSNLFDCIAMMCKRAESVLLVLSGQFEGESASKWSSEINLYALESAINEIRDIQEVMESYCTANSEGGVK